MADKIILVGMMGAGKTTVGRALADRLGWTHCDSDAQVVAETGRSVPELFAEQGEAAFRAEESRVLAEALSHPGPAVVSAAGGVVLSPDNRALLARSGTVVWLRADPQLLIRRVGSGQGRPLLDPDPAVALAELYRVRRPLYESVAQITLDVDGRSAVRGGRRPPGRRAPGVNRNPNRGRPVSIVGVELGDRRYDVTIGAGVSRQLAEVVGATVPGAARAAVVTQAAIGASVDPGLPHEVFTVPDGEGAKSLSTVEDLCRGFARSGLSRADVIIAVGGGVVTDLAGYAAASFHRGTPYVNVATSLLAQVDAAIGGKTGVNIPEGKNLVGAFWQPRAVLCDTGLLATLPPREWASGRGEMAKYAFLGTLLAGQEGGAGEPDASLLDLPLDEQVARCVSIKADVVAADEREGDRRMLLNYGHTLAHALEAASFDPAGGPDLRHGEAVAVGLVFAALLARRLGRIDDAGVERHRQVVGAFDLPGRLPAGVDADRLVSFMARDKKAHQDLTFILDGDRGVEVVRGIEEGDVIATLADMATTGSADRT